MTNDFMNDLIHKFLDGRKLVILILLMILCIQLAVYFFLYQRANLITPPGRVHAMQNLDAFYPDVIRQSKLGSWGYEYTLTTLPTKKVYAYMFFIGAGKIAAIFNIDPVTMYEVTRITGAIAVFAATYWLITLLLPITLHIPAIIFTLLFEPFPLWNNLMHTPVGQWASLWIFEPPVVANRFGFPHHLWAEAIGFSLICMIIQTVKKFSWTTLIIIVILSVAGPLSSPTFFAILATCLFPSWLVYAAATKTLKRSLLPIVFAMTGIVCVSLFTKAQFSSAGQPWDTFITTEKSWWDTDFVIKPFIQSFSLYYLFVIVLLITAPLGWTKWSNAIRRTFFLSLSWSVLPVMLIYLSALPWVPLVNGRISSDLSRVPIGILATLAFYSAGRIKYFRRAAHIFVTLFFFLAVAASILLSESYVNQMMQSQDNVLSKDDNGWTVYPSLDLWNGMMALKNVPVWSHVLIYPHVGDLLHAYVPVRSYMGRRYGETDYIARWGLSSLFYTGEMSNEDVGRLFTDNDISYVFFGPEEKYAKKTLSFYDDILEVIYKNPEVLIYKVRPLPQ